MLCGSIKYCGRILFLKVNVGGNIEVSDSDAVMPLCPPLLDIIGLTYN